MTVATAGAPPPVALPVRAALRFARPTSRCPPGWRGAGPGRLLRRCLAPLFIHPSDLSVIEANGPLLGPPSAPYPLGTDQAGRSVLALVIWGLGPR